METHGLRALKRKWWMESIISFGDGQNDKSMIEWARTGVAMGNAVDEVKAVAQMVTANNNEDGIAVALDQLLG